jgi:hypothetical protein
MMSVMLPSLSGTGHYSGKQMARRRRVSALGQKQQSQHFGNMSAMKGTTDASEARLLVLL